MEIRPILSAMLRNKTAPLLIAAQVALTLAIVCNALYIINDRLSTAARPSGADEANVSEMRFYPHRAISDIRGMQLRDMEAIRAVPGVVSAAWTNQVGAGTESIVPLVAGGRVFAASTSGTVVAINGTTGQDVWRLNLGTPIAAGVGSDGQTAAVVTQSNQLIAIADGRELWRVRLPARAFTAPLVAGCASFCTDRMSS